MAKGPVEGLTIRSAVVRASDLGNILACDLRREQADDAHAYVFKWQAGTFTRSEANFDAHSICAAMSPEPCLLFISEAGEYGIHSKGGSRAGDIVTESRPAAKKSRRGGFRSVAEIAGKAYAVGFRGMAYRLDKIQLWARIDEGLPGDFDIEAIHGFDEAALYAVGDKGQVWQFDGERWTRRELPTNANLNAVKCAGDDNVYIAGDGGALLRGVEDTWEIVENEVGDDIWDLEWFAGRLYASTMDGVYVFDGDALEAVDFGRDAPNSCYQLTAAENVLWSVGEYDIMAFDGRRWMRVV